MIPRPQHFGDRAPFPCHWSGIVRIFQETLLEALLLSARGRAHYPGEQPYASVEDYHRSKLAAGQDVIAYGDRFEAPSLEDTFVESFEPAAQQDYALPAGNLAYTRLRQRRSTRRQRKHRPFIRNAIERSSKHVRPKHHPRPAAGRRIVDAAMLVGRKVADVGRFHAPDAVL